MTCLFCFVLGFGGDARLDFGFLSNFTVSACNFLRFSLALLLTFFRSLTDGYCFQSAILLDWLEIID